MRWSFFIKNTLFLALLSLPYLFPETKNWVIHLTDGAFTHHFKLPFVWALFVGVLWLFWSLTHLLKRGFLKFFSTSSDVQMTRALVYLDEENVKGLDSVITPKLTQNKAWAAIINFWSKKGQKLDVCEALNQSKNFPELEFWHIRQGLKVAINKGHKEDVHTTLMSLFESGDHSPWTLDHLFYSCLEQGDTDVAAEVLRVGRKEELPEAQRVKWEGLLLLHKAKQWTGPNKKRIWLLEKALILANNELGVFEELIRLHIQENSYDKALEVLGIAWQTEPKRALVKLFCTIHHKSTKTERFESAKEIIRKQKDHPLSLLLLGFSALGAHLKPFVVQAIGTLEAQGYLGWALYLNSRLLTLQEKPDQPLSLSYQSLHALDKTLQTFSEHFHL